MKLYATTTSERATKGQGGNEYLEIDITIKDDAGERPFCTLRLEEKEYTFELFNKNTGENYDSIDKITKTKGEKKKGESIDVMECDKCKSKLNDDYFCNTRNEYQ
jgi:hypothetical protein